MSSSRFSRPWSMGNGGGATSTSFSTTSRPTRPRRSRPSWLGIRGCICISRRRTAPGSIKWNCGLPRSSAMSLPEASSRRSPTSSERSSGTFATTTVKPHPFTGPMQIPRVESPERCTNDEDSPLVMATDSSLPAGSFVAVCMVTILFTICTRERATCIPRSTIQPCRNRDCRRPVRRWSGCGLQVLLGSAPAEKQFQMFLDSTLGAVGRKASQPAARKPRTAQALDDVWTAPHESPDQP